MVDACLIPFYPMKTFIVLFALFSGCALFAQNKGPQTLDELQREIEIALKQTGTPGVAIVIVREGKVEWQVALGLADVAAKKPMTTKTLMRLGSVSKGFVALAALKLQEEGKLKLTDTLRQWVPECPIANPWEATDPVRLEHLLEHTSGVPEMDTHEYAHNDPKPVTMAESLAFDPKNRHVRWRPGSRKAYSNYGTQLAAAIVEKAAGQRLEDYVRENLFLPLGMTTAGYFLTPEAEKTLATTYRRGDGRIMPYSHIVYRAAGAVSASIEDMTGYLRFHLERGSLDGRRILGEESMDRLEVPRTMPAVKVGVTTGYGLLNGAAFTKGYEAHGHGGEVDGAQSLMGYIPELGIGRVILINSNDSAAMGWIRWLVDGYIEREIQGVEPPAAATLSADAMRGLAGYYANVAPRTDGFMGLVEYYRDIRRAVVDQLGMTLYPLPLPGGRSERWVAMGDKVFRRWSATKPAMGLVTGEQGETLLQHDYGTWRKVSAVRVWTVVGGFALSLLLLLSSALFALVWGTRKLIGRLSSPGPWSVRTSPLLGLVGLVGFWFCYATAGDAGFAVLGTFNAWTLGMMVTSLLIPLGAALSVVAVWRHRKAPMNRVAYWHSVAVALALVWLTGFCLHWGIIGVRMWI
jgi:CubicO group peptidase (beta-lactamase class C family)